MTYLSNVLTVLLTVGFVGFITLWSVLGGGYGGMAAIVVVTFLSPLVLVTGIASLILNSRYTPLKSITNKPFKVLLITSYTVIALWLAFLVFIMGAG